MPKKYTETGTVLYGIIITSVIFPLAHSQQFILARTQIYFDKDLQAFVSTKAPLLEPLMSDPFVYEVRARGSDGQETEVWLTPFKDTDKARMLQMITKEVYDCTINIPFPYTEANAQSWIRKAHSDHMQHGRPLNYVIRDSPDGQLIGSVGLIPHEGASTATVGYWLAVMYWGRGIITACVRRVCEMAFEEMGITKLEARVFEGNLGSLKVLQKSGFTEIDFRKDCLEKAGQKMSVHFFELDRS